MFRRSILAQAVLIALIAPMAAQAEVTVKGNVTNRTAIFVKDGQTIGEAKTMLDNSTDHDAGDLLMFENAVRLYIDGDIAENTSWHVELAPIYDTEALDDWKGHENYSQYDYLREAYIDTEAAGFTMRLGKQQVVWGTADGIKLLDVINPTDYRHFAQDPMEDSRIPVWMANIERNMGSAGSVQFIASQAEPNRIPGLNDDGDYGHPFMMQGVDAITGQVNGFVNIVPALAKTAQSFTNAAAPFFGSQFGLAPFGGLTVDAFASNSWAPTGPDNPLLPPGNPTFAINPAGQQGAVILNNIAQNGLKPGDANGNNNKTRVLNVFGAAPTDVVWDVSNPTAAFDHMPNATYATFNTFSSTPRPDPVTVTYATGGSATARYREDRPDWENLNFGFRYKNNTAAGLNYSLNYLYQYDPNPYVDLSWHDKATGEKLQVQRAPNKQLGPFLVPDASKNLAASQIPSSVAPDASNAVNILLKNSNGQYYGAFPLLKGFDPTTGQPITEKWTGSPVELRFTEKLQRIHNIGTALDYALDTEALGPIVLRGEFLYQVDVMQPIIDKRLLGIGDLTNALVMEESDMFKYVIGADITVLTNMMVSFQFIQFINLDYVDEGRNCTTQAGNSYDCSRYTGDFPTMNVTNSLRAAEEYKEFYSLFFSKPFGDAQEHRWNNITIYEENGGWWNRFDVEYSVTNDFIVSAAWNQYWGDFDTQFGQMENASNLQVGLKYLF